MEMTDYAIALIDDHKIGKCSESWVLLIGVIGVIRSFRVPAVAVAVAFAVASLKRCHARDFERD